MSKAILDAMKTRLYATSSLTDLVGQKIYLNSGPANQTLPLVIFAATDFRTTPFFGGLTKHELDVEFQIQYPTSSGLDMYNVADAISTALSTPITVTGFDAARATRLSRGVPSFTDDGWTMIERWRVIAHDI
jgi:hypothetical protein